MFLMFGAEICLLAWKLFRLKHHKDLHVIILCACTCVFPLVPTAFLVQSSLWSFFDHIP